ncbi:MAG TPA: 4a-hydroxytetrahydrobiopterin dehydratase [Bacteroidetes bacterium]|nr:4a-hydroxytetrahydrobiopterin dehydratase [Bacteroidota bacterium]HRR09600.1 4a-hydroxytetrahydrobiopterin dehydratase [Rhodothermales bacterium]
MSIPLSPERYAESLAQLPGWRLEDRALKKTFHFTNFRTAISAMVRLSFEAEALNHHPEWLNVWNRVEITLRTHDAGNQVTDLDLTLAHKIEAALSEFG